MSVALGLCLQPAKIPEVLSHVPNLLLQLVHQGCMCADSVCMIISLVKVIHQKGEYWCTLVNRKLISGRYWCLRHRRSV